MQSVACETARMSYPGRMGGVVKAGTKKAVEWYFMKEFPIETVWTNAGRIAHRFDGWHQARVHELGNCLERGAFVKKKTDRGVAIAAKLLNTFMHQLMKYEPCRPLWHRLHLPLDRRILKVLLKIRRSAESRALKGVEEVLRKPPYSLTHDEYIQVQRALRHLLRELNNRRQSQVKLTSPIELNLLWVE